jgi:diguanylate cyclase (GGDEF)-like protein/putative nucleotidyltransferase with HDIG domain
MNGLPGELTIDSGERTPLRSGLPRRAMIFLALMGAATLAAAAVPVSELTRSTHGWWTFLFLGTAAAATQLFVARTPRGAARYYTTIVFLVAGVLLLPVGLVALLGIVQHIPEWLKMRYPWYIQTFNIINYTADCLVAWCAVHLAIGQASSMGDAQQWALAGVVASLVFVLTNHVLLAAMMHIADRTPISKSDLFTLESLSTDLILAFLGVALATLWLANRWLIIAAVAPLILIHRSLNVPALEEEARVDSKTGLFNARHFASELRDELARAERFDRPMSVIMIDLDLLREINNTYGHLAGDAVLRGIAETFRGILREYDVPSRFGGEEFAILLPETTPEEAFEIADRIRRTVAATAFEVETSSEPIRATISCGVAGYPKDGTDVNELIHQADLAVYRAKLQGRNRALGASSEPLLVPADRTARLAVVPDDAEFAVEPPSRSVAPSQPMDDGRNEPPKRHMAVGPRFLALSPILGALIALIALGGIAAGIAGFLFSGPGDVLGLVAVVVAVGIGQALAVELDGGGSVSVSAVGALAGAAMFGPRAALPLAVTIAAVQWSAMRNPIYQSLFNVGALSLASLSAAAIFAVGWTDDGAGRLVIAVVGLVAGAAYFVVNTGMVSGAMALEGHDSWRRVWMERFSWLLPHYVAFGAIAGAIALSYQAIGLYGLAVFVLPLLLMRKTMAAYIGHTQRSSHKLRAAAETIRSQNASLEQANKLLKERSTAAMESLSATVDARDAYTAGHSRRVQQLALAIGRELGLSQAELDLLGHAALFHDIGKLAVPDAILLKPATLTTDEWTLMQRHADEGARIIDRLGFLNDAVPAIRHHHERYDGLGYPDGLAAEEIPLGARIIHVADALDSMLTTRIYRAARPVEDAVAELHLGSGTQFCPRCVSALERLVESGELGDTELRMPVLATAS